MHLLEVTARNVSRHFQMSPGRKNPGDCSWLWTTVLISLPNVWCWVSELVSQMFRTTDKDPKVYVYKIYKTPEVISTLHNLRLERLEHRNLNTPFPNLPPLYPCGWKFKEECSPRHGRNLGQLHSDVKHFIGNNDFHLPKQTGSWAIKVLKFIMNRGLQFVSANDINCILTQRQKISSHGHTVLIKLLSRDHGKGQFYRTGAPQEPSFTKY